VTIERARVARSRGSWRERALCIGRYIAGLSPRVGWLCRSLVKQTRWIIALGAMWMAPMVTARAPAKGEALA